MRSPRFFLGFGLFLMLMGIVLPLMMVIHLLRSTFFLDFLSQTVSVLGFALGMIGVSWAVRRKHK
jgi:uncharacterized membrane protein YqjE